MSAGSAVKDRWAALLAELARHERAQGDAYHAAAAARGSPCLGGCHGCCHRLVLVDLADALWIARELLDRGAVTAALRRALAEDAERAERLSPEEVFSAARGCVFLDRSSPGAACTIYEVRPHDCRIWFIEGVDDDSFCGPGAPHRDLVPVVLPDREQTDLRWRARTIARFGPAAARPAWVPLALGVLAALDAWELGAAALSAWRPRLDVATARSYALVDRGP